jgi:hypothetical protein
MTLRIGSNVVHDQGALGRQHSLSRTETIFSPSKKGKHRFHNLLQGFHFGMFTLGNSGALTYRSSMKLSCIMEMLPCYLDYIPTMDLEQ